MATPNETMFRDETKAKKEADLLRIKVGDLAIHISRSNYFPPFSSTYSTPDQMKQYIQKKSSVVNGFKH